jgi:hypothetical protein
MDNGKNKLKTRGNIPQLGIKDLPPAPKLRTLFGPSFILLGLGLGSGEIVLWPYMASNYGLGIMWGMLTGITMQFFINMEVSRYALINGESVFVGFARLVWWLPIWLIISTFLGFGWPGIGLYGASLFSSALDSKNIFGQEIIGVALFILIGIILSVGKVLYQTVEQLQKILIGIGVPLIVGITYFLAPLEDIQALGRGLIGIGESSGEKYLFLPHGIVLGTFLGALAYAGAGGNLNLTQSCYVRDKGYGMGKYAQRITSLFYSNKDQSISLTGNTFPINEKNIKKYNEWWKAINWEHFLVFWALGLFTMLTLSLLAYTTSASLGLNSAGLNFILVEAQAIANATLPVVGTIFLLILGVMLSATQLTILDSTSRIIAENIMLLNISSKKMNISSLYYFVLWIQISFGIAVFTLGFNQPMKLILLGAVINAFSMFVYTGILLWLNNTILAKELRPSLFRNFILLITFLFFGSFCAMTAYLEIIKL